MHSNENQELNSPPEYREFLLRINGGCPEHGHLEIKGHGPTLPLDIGRFFFIADGESDPTSLNSALARHREKDFPAHYMPIATARFPSPFGGTMDVDLLLGLAGKRAGKIVMSQFSAFGGPIGAMSAGAPPAMVRQMFESGCMVVASSLPALLSRLAPRPTPPAPGWLEAVRAGDVARFVQWLKTGGNVDNRFAAYGELIQSPILAHVIREATAEFFAALVKQSNITPTKLLYVWQQFVKNVSAFKRLMPLISKDQWHRAFACSEIWKDAELLDQLVAAGVNLEASIDDEGSTPLHVAAQAGQVDGVRWLLAHGASPGKPDRYGRTALCWAESERHLECLELLVEAGESIESLFHHMPTMRDKLSLLKRRWLDRYGELAKYLQTWGIDVSGD
jgi:hypothetical protein